MTRTDSGRDHLSAVEQACRERGAQPAGGRLEGGGLGYPQKAPVGSRPISARRSSMWGEAGNGS